MNKLVRFRRVGLAVLRAALKSILIAVLIICVVYPTTTVLSITRTPLAVPSHHSFDGHHRQHKGIHAVDTGIHEVLGSQAKMMIEHVPLLRRDTESSMNDPPSMRVPPSGRKHGRSDSDIAQPLERSVDLADGKDDIDHHSDITIRSTIFDRAAQASGGGWGRVKPKPKPQKPPPQATAREDISELQARHDCWSGESVYPAISIRDAQDSADSYGPCARPKNKVLPTKATVKTDASDQQLSPNHHDDMTTHSAIAARYTSGSFDLPGKPCRGNKPCYCHPPVVASKSELKTAEIQPRRMRDKCNGHPCLLDRPRFGPPAVASRSESKRTEIQPRDVNCCNGRPCLIHRPFYCARGGTSKLESKTTEIQPRRIPCQPCSLADPVLDRDETVPEGKYKQRSNLYALSECPCGNSKRDDKPDGTGIQDTRIADVMAVLNSRDNLTMVNNATGIAPKNATKIDHDVQKAMYTAQAGVLVLYAVMVVTGLCFTLLFFICIRHCCIRRHRRNALASRRTSYPYKPEISQIESRPNAPTNGSTRMNRIDEEVGEEDVAPQPMTTLDGANDGWTRWLLQKRDTRQPKHTPPTPKPRAPPRIPTLRLPQPTFSTVRKANGIKTETRAETSMGYDWFRSKGRDATKAKGTSVV